MKTKIFFFGTPDIATPSLQALAMAENIEVIGVGVFPDRPVGRKQILTPCPVKVTARDLGLPIYEIGNRSELEALFNDITFDLGIVIAFGQIFPESILNIPKLGVVNVHFSLLPAYRGASPVQSAILNGDPHSGITWQRMVKRLDAGDVLYQIPHPIADKSTAQCWQEMAEATADHFPAFVQKYGNGKITPEVQNEDTVTYCGKFERADGEIFPDTEAAETIYRKYLAFDPWPGIYWQHPKHGRLKIIKCHLEKESLVLDTVQLAGKKPVPAASLGLNVFSDSHNT